MNTLELIIQGRKIGAGNPCLIIAEVAQAHDGSLGMAHAYIDAATDAGADAVKFQTHIASAESTPAEPWRVKFSQQDANRYDYWKRTEFTEEQWRGLSDHARERGLIFLSSPFSSEAIDLLERINMSAWKVGSGEVGNIPLIAHMVKMKKPILLSSGLSSFTELDATVDYLNKHDASFAIFQCTSAYPCPPEKIGLNVIGEFKKRYKSPVGLSDHSGTIFPSLAALALGANMVEVHIVFSKACFGPDVSSSITIEQLSELVKGARFIDKAIGNPVDKTIIDADRLQLRKIFGKSIYAARDLVSGHRIVEDDIALKKPGLGMPPSKVHDMIGRILKRSIAKNALLTEEDCE